MYIARKTGVLSSCCHHHYYIVIIIIIVDIIVITNIVLLPWGKGKARVIRVRKREEIWQSPLPFANRLCAHLMPIAGHLENAKKEMTPVFLSRVYLPNSSLPGGVKSVKLERARVPNRVYKCVCLLLVSRPTWRSLHGLTKITLWFLGTVHYFVVLLCKRKQINARILAWIRMEEKVALLSCKKKSFSRNGW